jgi:hypothetical protein
VTDLGDAATAQIRAAWADLLGMQRLDADTRRVFVDPQSALGPAGWVGILRLDRAVLVAVPTPHLEPIAVAAIADLSVAQVTDPALVAPRFNRVAEILGPSMLAYADAGSLRSVPATTVEQGTIDDPRLHELVASVPEEDAHEAGVLSCTSPAFFAVVRNRVVSACGYRVWADRLAHLCVLTAIDARNAGHGRAAGAAAAAYALDNGLIPQWRARHAPSQAVAAALGFARIGAQLTMRISESD